MTTASRSRLFRSALTLILGLSLMMASLSVGAQPREKKDPYLTDDDIELIKVYEVDLEAKDPPRITIPRDELRNFLKEFQEDDRIPRGKREQEKWLRLDGHKQLPLLFQLRARDYYKHVRVRSQIESLRAWGTIHRRYVLGYFQPTFGSGKIPSLFLFPQGRDSEKIEMTNFYILTQVTIDGKPLIDRNVPEESLLLQWGLPREEAKFPAPEIEGWQPEFKDTKDKQFVEMANWVKSLISANQGSSLGIEYKIPQHPKPRN